MKTNIIKKLLAYHLNGYKVKPMMYDMRKDEDLYRRNING